MNYFYLLYLLVALDGSAASAEPAAVAVEAPVCSAHGPLYAVEQFASRLRLASLPTCPTDGSHDAAGAEILSFEEWKALQFELQQQQQSNGSSSSSSPPTTTTAAGGNDTSTTPSEPDDAAPEHPSPPATESAAPSKLPSLKDRYNYASTDCSARITSSHRGAKSADSILSHKKDRYMLSPCSAKEQHVVVELCDDIRIDTVQLANFEFFSGVFRKFSVSVSVDAIAWEHAGDYEAKNVRGVQSFHPPQDLPNFYRYVRVDFKSHYGNEFYCPVSLLRVYGLTQMEKFKRELAEEQARTAAPVPVVAAPTVDVQAPEPTAADVREKAKETAEEHVQPKTETDQPSPSGTHGISDVALRPSIELADLEQCATSASVATSNASTATSARALDSTVTSATASTSATSVDAAHATISSSAQSPSNTVASNGSASASTSTPATTTATTKAAPPPPPPPPAKPTLTPGDSIYRTIMNRLTLLEGNSTLVMRFVEQQAINIRDALRRLEEDVGRLDGITKSQQTLFARTLLEMERERRALDEERVMLMRKVANLSDEVVLEKRLGIAQLALLVAVLLFLAVTRGSGAVVAFPPARSRTSSLFMPDLRPRDRVTSDPKRRIIESSRPLQNPQASPAPSRAPVPFPADSPRTRDFTFPRSRTPTLGLGRPKTPTPKPARLRRSNSNVTSPEGVMSPSSASLTGRKLARTAHLHEVQVRRRGSRTPRTGLASPSPTPDPEPAPEEWVTDTEELETGKGTWQVEESPLAARRRRSRGVSIGVAG
ncbi:hypothetical protein EXIGLDRAFT_773186 [Exidia glandulosa HHB12029]|uniref:SUN domain-containing protein n=1 Tax=Exidia glandulosa HHB12029 TaxID=1314781 RepID=A0A165EX38_EXIGL|nr:hypothetical protein EXIGLDRAFT_773186 [Exidia glandulosa HHB12029]